MNPRWFVLASAVGLGGCAWRATPAVAVNPDGIRAGTVRDVGRGQSACDVHLSRRGRLSFSDFSVDWPRREAIVTLTSETPEQKGRVIRWSMRDGAVRSEDLDSSISTESWNGKLAWIERNGSSCRLMRRESGASTPVEVKPSVDCSSTLALSPDGIWLAEGASLEKVAFDGQSILRIPGGRRPATSPDGKNIAFVRDGAVVVARNDSQGEIVVATRVDLHPNKQGSLGWNEDGSLTFSREVTSPFKGGPACLTYNCIETVRIDLNTRSQASLTAGTSAFFTILLVEPATCPDPVLTRQLLSNSTTE